MLYFARARTDDGLLGNYQWLIVGRGVNGVTDQVVDRSGRVENGAGAEDRSLFYHRAFVHAAITADHHFVFDDYRHRADWFDDAADLRTCGDVTLFSNLRATADQRVGVDHRTFVNVGADIDEHRRHTDYAARDVAAIANAGAAGNQAHSIIEVQRFHRISGLVEERLRRRIRPHLDD